MNPLTPDHHFYIDQGTNAHVRLVLVAIGRALVAADVLDDPEDVMFLRYNELRVLIGDPDALRREDARRATGATTASEASPFGRRSGSAPRRSRSSRSPTTRSGASPRSSTASHTDAADTIHGLAGSPGAVEGMARLVRSVDEFDQVQDGEILVCQMTNPAWVVLFTRIGGLVTDAGGVASHPAVVAREFGLPAVVGTSVATKLIATGDRVRVNGATGVVDVLERASEVG